MKEPDTRTVFAGVDGRADAQLPDWYAEKRDVDDPVSFAEAVRELPRAAEATVAYQNPITEEWVETDRFNAIVEPRRLREQARGEEDADPKANSTLSRLYKPIRGYRGAS